MLRFSDDLKKEKDNDLKLKTNMKLLHRIIASNIMGLMIVNHCRFAKLKICQIPENFQISFFDSSNPYGLVSCGSSGM